MKKGRRKIRAKVLQEMSFLEALLRRCPQDIEILKALGDLYTKTSRYEAGLAIDLELSRLCPQEAVVWYNLACSYARLASKDQALAALARAIDLGYRDHGWMRKDADLASLRADRRFMALLQRLISGKQVSPR
ncbi:MAG: hypothetical protein GX806_02010 [Lentisphaerae bacterium]|nr:hypothetical protein [Lentisphaerota bacterium]